MTHDQLRQSFMESKYSWRKQYGDIQFHMALNKKWDNTGVPYYFTPLLFLNDLRRIVH